MFDLIEMICGILDHFPIEPPLKGREWISLDLVHFHLEAIPQFHVRLLRGYFNEAGFSSLGPLKGHLIHISPSGVFPIF